MFCRAPLPALGSLLVTERSEWPAQLPALSSLGAPGQAIGSTTCTSSAAAISASVASTAGSSSVLAVQASTNQGGDAAQLPQVGLLASTHKIFAGSGTAVVSAVQGYVARTSGSSTVTAASPLSANMGGGPAQFASIGLLDRNDCRAQTVGSASVAAVYGYVATTTGSSAAGAASVTANMGGDPAQFPFIGLLLRNLGSWGVASATGSSVVRSVFNDGDVFISIPTIYVATASGSSAAFAYSAASSIATASGSSVALGVSLGAIVTDTSPSGIAGTGAGFGGKRQYNKTRSRIIVDGKVVNIDPPIELPFADAQDATDVSVTKDQLAQEVANVNQQLQTDLTLSNPMVMASLQKQLKTLKALLLAMEL